jgi:hypothetical protein
VASNVHGPGAFPHRISVSQSGLIRGALPNVKALSRDQLQARKEKAVRFVRDVLGDPDRAEEIEEESLEDYAERRKITLTNPSGKATVIMTKQELLDRVQDLEEENQQLV